MYCLSYFSTAETKHHGQVNLEKEAFNLEARRSRGLGFISIVVGARLEAIRQSAGAVAESSPMIYKQETENWLGMEGAFFLLIQTTTGA